jgi:predicted NUDIX family NTP pyrophosphohydrolase/uncharacterized protein YndB with AHSA1/START domain
VAGKRSAGILLFRRAGARIEVLLGHMGGPFWSGRDAGAWSVPKGEYEPNENPASAARREFEEELGLPVPAADLIDLGEVRQSGGKVVTVWAAESDLDPGEIVPGTFTMEWPRASGRFQDFPEVDRVAWLGLEQAREKIVVGQRAFLDRLAGQLAEPESDSTGRGRGSRMTDIASLINDTHREIGSRRIAAGGARTVLIRRGYDAMIDDVWDACTDPDRLNRWFLDVTGDLRLGGTYRLEGNAHGEILRCEPPRLLAVSWIYGDRPVDEVELRLSPAGDGGTVLELEHATVVRQVEWEGRSVDVITGLGPGWEPALLALDRYLSGELPDTVAAEWRSASPPAELTEFIDRTGKIWAALADTADTDNDATPGPA